MDNNKIENSSLNNDDIDELAKLFDLLQKFDLQDKREEIDKNKAEKASAFE